MTVPASPRNRLALESSAYLLQHASNPVDWYPWGDEALAKARCLDRPILLSIGYSACHWCHVMERECFEDRDIAALMNSRFVCIKVDREERPDLDQVYMKALQGMTGRGGWPMTMFLTPQAKPFYGGTYFPPEDRDGMPGLARVILGVSQTWTEKRDAVLESAERMVAFLEEGAVVGIATAWTTEAQICEAAEKLESSMDAEHGGFGRAPKFPSTMALSLLLETADLRADSCGPDLVRLALDAMAAGGIRDHLGGGFHRYAVDREWLIPHFEKMLYDQALIAPLYMDAADFFEEPAYATVAEEILDYVVREMTSPDGGFYTAQDADSEGVEGKFFVWSADEIAALLGRKDAAIFCETYGVEEGGNFDGSSILHRARRSRGHGGKAANAPGEDRRLEASRAMLLRERARRVAPQTDRKIMADWNGLMISAMARVGSRLGRKDLVECAARALRFVFASMVDDTGLRHVHCAGSQQVPGFLDDYAFFGRACLDLFAVEPQSVYLETATWCASRLLEAFRDGTSGAFRFTGSRGEPLIASMIDLYDGTVPAGNSVAAELLFRLWVLDGEENWRQAGQAVLDRFAGEALRNPHGGAYLLAIAERCRRGWRTVVLVGESADRVNLEHLARRTYDPGCTVIALESRDQPWYPPALRGKTAPPQGACAYLCEGTRCTLPLATWNDLQSALGCRGQARGVEVEGS